MLLTDWWIKGFHLYCFLREMVLNWLEEMWWHFGSDMYHGGVDVEILHTVEIVVQGTEDRHGFWSYRLDFFLFLLSVWHRRRTWVPGRFLLFYFRLHAKDGLGRKESSRSQVFSLLMLLLVRQDKIVPNIYVAGI
jgi:hypothetical protein